MSEKAEGVKVPAERKGLWLTGVHDIYRPSKTRSKKSISSIKEFISNFTITTTPAIVFLHECVA